MITHGFLIKDYKNHIRDALKTTDPSNEKKMYYGMYDTLEERNSAGRLVV